MKNHEQIHTRLEHVLSEWVDKHLKEVTPYTPFSMHIDEIIKVNLTGLDSLNLTTRMFVLLVQKLALQDFPVMPAIGIPLKSYGLEMVRIIPGSKHEVYADLDIEPPSLYLLDWEPSRRMTIIEEYNYPLTFDLIENAPVGTYAYYKEFRFSRAIQANSEYLRGIFAEYYPLGLREQ